jgi:hypothetical protein
MNPDEISSFWEIIMAQPEAERHLFLQEHWLSQEDRHLNALIAYNQVDEENIAWFRKMAEFYVHKYRATKEDSDIEAAEQYMELIKLTKQSKYPLADIRKQRERVQWERRKLAKMKSELPTEPEPFSSPSENSNPTS